MIAETIAGAVALFFAGMWAEKKRRDLRTASEGRENELARMRILDEELRKRERGPQ